LLYNIQNIFSKFTVLGFLKRLRIKYFLCDVVCVKEYIKKDIISFLLKDVNSL
jgi:hypothetical protein